MHFVRWRQVLERRLSRRTNLLILGHRNLYIFPSRFGFLWFLASGLLYLVGINTRSNGPLMLSFLMGSLMLLALFLTHFNLQGLELEALPQPLGFAGESFRFRIQARSNIERPGLVGVWLNTNASPLEILHIKAGEETVNLQWPVPGRGLHNPGRLLLFTTAPLGLFRCWTYWEPQLKIWIAPSRSPGPVLEVPEKDLCTHNGDEFSDLKPWRQGENLQRFDWKALARGRGWLNKQFNQPELDQLWLAPSPKLPTELALEHLCYRLCIELNRGQAVGLELPGGQRITPSNGPEHRENCLKLLAELPT